MDFDDEPAPWQLEQLVSSFSETDHEPSHDDQDEDSFWRYSEANLVLNTEYFSAKLKQLLGPVRDDDPLLQTTQHKPCVPAVQGHPFTIRDVRGKGLGVLATRRIPAGSILLTDPFLLSIHEPAAPPPSFFSYSSSASEDDTAAEQREKEEEEELLLLRMALLQLAGQYATLPLPTRQQLAGLHAHAEPGTRQRLRAALLGKDPSSSSSAADTDTDASMMSAELRLVERLYFTFSTNEFSRVEQAPPTTNIIAGDGGGGGAWRTRRLFLTTSRINHSCSPNARSGQTTDGRKVVTALRDIEEGEEVTLRYLDHRWYAREEWREATQRMWGFVCNCRGCAGKVDGE